MRKLFLLLAVAMFAVSCNDSPDVTGHVELISIPASSWELVTNEFGNEYYAATFNFPLLDRNVFKFGDVIAYRFVDNGATLIPLPDTRHFETTERGIWSESVTYEYGVGTITFIVINSDFVYPTPPGAMNVRVVLLFG